MRWHNEHDKIYMLSFATEHSKKKFKRDAACREEKITLLCSHLVRSFLELCSTFVNVFYKSRDNGP